MPKLTHPDNGTVWATAKGAVVLRRRGYVDYGQPAAHGTERPAEYASRGEWDMYARSIGLDPDGFSSKAALIAAINGGNTT